MSDITFKKVKRSIRVKQPPVVLPKDEDDEEEEAGNFVPALAPAGGGKPSTASTSLSILSKSKAESNSTASKPKKSTVASAAEIASLPTSASALSFQDDLVADGGEEFRVKKSSNSRKLAKRQRLRYDKSALASSASASATASASADKRASAEEDEIQVVEMEDDYPVSVEQLQSQVASQGIPDSRIVYQLKRQRQLAALARRANRGGDGGGGGSGNEDADSDAVSDNSDADAAGVDAGDGGGLRVRLMGTLKPEAQRRQMRDQFLSAEHGSPTNSGDGYGYGYASDGDGDYDDDGEAAQSYERQQLRRAAAAFAGPASRTISGVIGDEEDVGSGGGGSGGIYSRLPTASGAGYADLRARVDADRRRLAELAAGETDRLAAAESELTACQQRLVDHEERLPRLEAAYRSLARLRSYLSDYVDCMSEKLGQVELLERRLFSALGERAQRQIRRRRQDVKDESSGAAWRHDDEVTSRRVAEREARRTRRRRQRELNGTDAEHDSGLSSDDEETSAERMARESVIDQVRHVQETQLFVDVLPEYCQLKPLLTRLAEFRADQPDLYERARLPACLARLLSPLVRVQLLLYNPLAPDCLSHERHAWLDCLLDYLDLTGHPDEVKIVPDLVDQVVLPRVTELVQQIWDPMSNGECVRLSRLLSELVRDYPSVHAGSPRTQRLCLAVHDRLADFVAKEPFIPLMQPNPAESAFYNRQLVQAIKLFVNTLRFSELLSPTALHRLSADCLLSRYILVGLGSLPVTDRLLARLDAVLNALPSGYQLPQPFAELVKRVTATAATASGLSVKSRIVLSKFSSLYWVK